MLMSTFASRNGRVFSPRLGPQSLPIVFVSDCLTFVKSAKGLAPAMRGAAQVHIVNPAGPVSAVALPRQRYRDVASGRARVEYAPTAVAPR